MPRLRCGRRTPDRDPGIRFVKLLFDENLSPKLVGLVSDLYPDSAHVHDRGLGASDDAKVWAYAAAVVASPTRGVIAATTRPPRLRNTLDETTLRRRPAAP